ncbi:MAG: DEAD/DEAH box helicase family protein [Pseudomonadota bacterium]|nr:DEAD/DEAH box helicase family protein [Pseudomonadota bacterium]
MKRNLARKQRPSATTAQTFNAFLDHLRASAKSEREKGELFELAIRDYLRQSPEHDFANVWLWRDWPQLKEYGFTKKDSGIDLVAKERGAEKIWAIQCKFYQESSQMDRKANDSFLASARGEPFAAHLIVTTTYNWGENAREILHRQGKNCRVLDSSDLSSAPFDWFDSGKVKRHIERKPPRAHQLEAVAKAKTYFAKHERGKLIMACGTGKTYTSLQIVEEMTAKRANILFLAPSISLIAQTLREYAYEHRDEQRYVIVCSDSKADRDSDGYTVADLSISPTTDASRIAEALKVKSKIRTVVFCTYQSLERIKQAQEQGAPQFDLAICDEAHRTTGVEGTSRGGNYFTLINNANYVSAAKRLYMTATPRIYADNAKRRASDANVEIHSMDDGTVYGQEFYQLDFSSAIKKRLLSDYKVIILTISETYASEHLQGGLAGSNLDLSDAAKLVGCYKSLRDQGEVDKGVKLSRAVGFVNSIKTSQDVTNGFDSVVSSLDRQENDGFTCETKHIDGTDNSIERHQKLEWLKEEAGYSTNQEKICRILMSSKCLTEGIDVPSLDAILFLQPRKSQVDVVQAVGRVMRKQEGKDYGYVILPVVIPAASDPVEALNDNETYKVVWQVLNALRSHDNGFDTTINNLHLNESKPDKIKVIGIGTNGTADKESQASSADIASDLQHNLADLSEKIFAKIVEKCGDRLYEEKWTKRIAQITDTVATTPTYKNFEALVI